MLRVESKRSLRLFLAAAAAAMLVVAVVYTPLRSYAEGFLTIFTPKQFVAVPLTESDLSNLPSLQDYGTLVQPSYPEAVRVDSAEAASSMSGMRVLVPASLPSGVQSAPRYEVMPGRSAIFTFSAEKAQAAAGARGQQLPPMPANIDGSSLQIVVGAIVLATYPGPENTQLPIPSLVIGQAAAPVVRSTGVSVEELQQYLLAQPGISQGLAQAVRGLGDPAATLPIPIPLNMAAAHPVQVQGVSGLAVADSMGLGSGVIWEKDGLVYGVAGPLFESELLAVANSLR